MSSIIRVSNLSKHFKDITAVDDLSFSVEQGDVYGFLGQNGAGKSTTIRMLLTLVKPSSGSIQIFGKSLGTHRGEILKNIGAVIEKPDLYKYLSAYDNLTIFSRLSGIRPEKSIIMKQLEMVGLAERAESKVKTFSQGMKQRIGIAVALIHDPQLIILDEPTNGLDPQGIADMRSLIAQLSRVMGKTVLVSSHLLREIELVANRILIIDKGKKIVEGNAAELLDPAKTIVQVETLDNRAAKNKLMSTKWASFLFQQGDTLRFQMNKSDIPLLTAELVSLGIPVLSIHPRHSLEDYFLSLTTPGQHVEPIAN